ncbi:MAG: ubiquinone/menaquinone biosynthesis methyltransferase [Chloroflexi bacterium]|nr:ubiquinone/menaquinone biosynthesis methyltransferase [Chloroflexota bacterium]
MVPTYDLMNRLMSLGQDQAWRRRAAALAAPEPLALGLDVATGTADLALALASRVRQVVGVDVCGPMLPVALAKVARAGRSHQLRFLLSDVYQLPFPDASFQCVTVGFGVRNMADPVAAFREMRRVLRPGGRVVCLEIMPPQQGLLGRGYRLYLTRLIPFVGGLVSGQPEAYHYLSTSVQAFANPQELLDIMYQSGYTQAFFEGHNLGTIAVHVGIR